MEEKKSKNDNSVDEGTKQIITVLTEVKKSIRGYEGVHSVTCGDQGTNRPFVVGEVDPAKLQQTYNKNKIENGRRTVELTRDKNVEIFSPLPKKHEDDNKKNGGAGEENRNKEAKHKPKENPEDKNSKPPVTTAELKVHLHCEQCEGCINEIKKIISNIEGYHEVIIDCAQDKVIVKGSMDMKALGESLKQELKKDVRIVLTQKDGEEKEKNSGGEGKTGGEGGAEEESERERE